MGQNGTAHNYRGRFEKLDSISLWDKMVLPSIHELEKVVRYTYFGPEIVHNIRGCIDVGICNLACINDFLILFFLSLPICYCPLNLG